MCFFDDKSQVSHLLRQMRKKHSLKEPSDLAQKDVLFVGGLDLSAVDENTYICAFTIYKIPKDGPIRRVYGIDMKHTVNVPYRAGYLGFREAEPMVKTVEYALKIHPEFEVDVLLVDGNGTLHPVGFGSACHVGVLSLHSQR